MGAGRIARLRGAAPAGCAPPPPFTLLHRGPRMSLTGGAYGCLRWATKPRTNKETTDDWMLDLREPGGHGHRQGDSPPALLRGLPRGRLRRRPARTPAPARLGRRGARTRTPPRARRAGGGRPTRRLGDVRP